MQAHQNTLSYRKSGHGRRIVRDGSPAPVCGSEAWSFPMLSAIDGYQTLLELLRNDSSSTVRMSMLNFSLRLFFLISLLVVTTGVVHAVETVTPTSVSASSFYKNEKQYSPENTLSSSDKAWVTVSNGNGNAGEWIKWEFDDPVELRYIEVNKGWGFRWRSKRRLKEVELTFSDNSSMQHTFEDESEQIIRIPAPVITRSVKMTIKSTYPGSSDRTGLRNILFFTPSISDPKLSQEQIEALKAAVGRSDKKAYFQILGLSESVDGNNLQWISLDKGCKALIIPEIIQIVSDFSRPKGQKSGNMNNISWTKSCEHGLAQSLGDWGSIKMEADNAYYRYMKLSGKMTNGMFEGKIYVEAANAPSGLRSVNSGEYWVYGDHIFANERGYRKELRSVKANPYFEDLRPHPSHIDNHFSFLEQFVDVNQTADVEKSLFKLVKEDIYQLQRYIDSDFISLQQRQIAAKEQKELLDTKHGISYRTTVKQFSKGERYVPQVINTYYESEDQSYTINGKYVSKYVPKKRVETSGGYRVGVDGYKALFELRNQSGKPKVVELSAKWTSNTFSYEKVKDRCLSMFFVCMDWSYKTEKVWREGPAEITKSAILGPDGALKQSFDLGEKSPRDLVFFVESVESIDKDIYREFSRLMGEDAMADPVLALELFKSLETKPSLKPFQKDMDRRMEAIKNHHLKKFHDEHIEDTIFSLHLPSDFDADFGGNAVIDVEVGGVPSQVILKTPRGERSLNADSKVRGVEVLDNCLLCRYSGRLVLFNIKGYSEEKLREGISIERVQPATWYW